MIASGRGVWSRKTRVDEVRSMDILDLQRNKIFSKGTGLIWTSSWSRNGEVVASVSYRVEGEEGEPTGLRFMYTITDKDTGKRQDYNYVNPVVSTPCTFGGKRWWYICPLVLNGDPCHRRCRIVYLPPRSKYFGCRKCHQLTYESRQRHREKFYEEFEKPFKTMRAIDDKLARTRSWEKKAVMLRKQLQAAETIENYTDTLINRLPVNICMEK